MSNNSLGLMVEYNQKVAKCLKKKKVRNMTNIIKDNLLGYEPQGLLLKTSSCINLLQLDL